MKKMYLLSLIAAMFVFGQTYAQVIFSDNFDSYNAGFQLACQNSTDWTTWDLSPCTATDAYVSNVHQHSGSNSFVVVQNNDEVHPIANYTSGKYEIDFYNYIPSGKAGYFNTLALFNGNSSEWGLEVYFNIGLAGAINAGGTNSAFFTWVADGWILNKVIVDLDADLAEYWYNGTMIYQWQWTLGSNGVAISDQLGGNDFFGATADDEMYVDDYSVNLFIVPVELTSFTAAQNPQGQVVLKWSTATETNNRVFEIERKTANTDYNTVGYVNGAGTSTERHDYSYVDKNVGVGDYTYRLKQIDFDGKFVYSSEVQVSAVGPTTFNLSQNYPNPFNPTTNISFTVPEAGNVKLAVYNTLGQEVAVLVNGLVTAGLHSATFNASSLPSGAYFYKLQSSNSVMIKKMMLLK